MELSEAQQFRVRMLLTLQVALLGWIRPSVRKVGAGWSDKHINVWMFHDGDPDEDDVDSASCVEAELMASFPDHEVAVSAVRVDYPKPILDIEGVSDWAYARWEPY